MTAGGLPGRGWLVVLLTVLANCATAPTGWTPLNGPALRGSHPRSIEIVVEEPAEFRNGNSKVLEALFPLPSAVVKTVRGTDTDDAFDVYLFGLALKDPTPRLGRSLAASLSKRYQLTVRGIRAAAAERFTVPSDLSLDVGTIDWAIDCTGYEKPDSYAEEPPTCAVIYRVRLRLTDNRNDQVVAAGDCQTAPTRQFLDAGEDPDAKVNVPLVQAALKEATDNCVDNLRRELLGVYGSAP